MGTPGEAWRHNPFLAQIWGPADGSYARDPVSPAAERLSPDAVGLGHFGGAVRPRPRAMRWARRRPGVVHRRGADDRLELLDAQHRPGQERTR
jgi:hypothetical protein